MFFVVTSISTESGIFTTLLTLADNSSVPYIRSSATRMNGFLGDTVNTHSLLRAKHSNYK